MSEAPASAAPAPTRLMSLDVFRGATIAGMMLVNNPGSWSHVYAPLDHAEWNGWTYTDTIFPFFLWIVGVAIPLSTSRRLEAGQSRKELFGHALRRAVIIFGLGFFLSSFGYFIDGSMARSGFSEWLHQYLTTVRIPGVLQRIAVCYLLAMLIFLTTGQRGQIRWAAGLLIGYWLLMAFVPIPQTADGETRWVVGLMDRGHNFAAYIDNLVLNGPVIGKHVWRSAGTWDPEGIVSTLPAIATVLFGIWTGHMLRTSASGAEKTVRIMVPGAILMWLGQLMNLWLPINKSIWTSSYSVFMAGLAMVVFGACYWIVDVQQRGRWTKPLAIYGMNAIALFVLSGLLGRLMNEIRVPTSSGRSVALKSFLYDRIFVPLASSINSSLLWAIMWVLLMYAIAYVMYRKKWFVKF
jgi:predicted acyltransferase